MSGRRRVVIIIAESLSEHDEIHVAPTIHVALLSGIRVGRRESGFMSCLLTR
jgi:hypothetical protein